MTFRLYSLKKPTHWLWRTNFTRDQVIARLDASQISEDWLVCPLGEANKAITVARFASNPTVFDPELRSTDIGALLNGPRKRPQQMRGEVIDVRN